jgi:hypothetical protein
VKGSVNSELFKYASQEFVIRFLRWNGEELPRNWRKVIIISVHRTGSIKDVENYRRINLFNSGYTVYADIIKNILNTYYNY